MPRVLDPDALQRGKAVLDAGGSLSQAERESGISRGALRSRYLNRSGSGPADDASPGDGHGAPPPSRPRDPSPQRRRGRKRSGQPSDEELEAMCRKLAKLPAIPMRLVVHCGYCADHFQHTAPIVAAELVDQARDDQDLHGMLVWMHSNWRRMAWAGTLGMWAGVPLLHHVAPRPVYEAVAPLAGMPPKPGGSHRHGPTPESSAMSGTPPVMPDLSAMATNGGMPDLSTLDPEQLMRMAASMGVEIDPDELASFLGAEPGVVPEPGDAPAQTVIDDFIEPEPVDIAVDSLDENGDQTESIPAGGDPPAAGAEAQAEAAGTDPNPGKRTA